MVNLYMNKYGTQLRTMKETIFLEKYRKKQGLNILVILRLVSIV